jgi:PAS domain S-box-containing protein
VIRSVRSLRRQGSQLRLRLAQQELIARLGQLALTDVPGQELLDEACRSVAAGLRVGFTAVQELLPSDEMVVRAAVGWPESIVGLHVPARPCSQGWHALNSKGPVIMRDAAAETRFEVAPTVIALGITSCVVTRIVADGRTYGVLGAHTLEQRDFSDHDVNFLDAVANILASALRRRAAEAESDSARRVLVAVIEGSEDNIVVKDVEGRVVALNARAAEALGRPQEELIGALVEDMLPKASADAIAENHRRAIARGTVETSEMIVPFGDEMRVFQATVGPYFGTDGALVGTFGIARDITARKAQSDELARSEESLRLAQEGARTGTWDVDLLAGVTTWSDGLRAIYGVTHDVPAGFDQFLALVHVDDSAMVVQFVADAYAHAVPFEFECRIIRPDGDLRWIMARATVRADEAGRPVRVLGVAVDITERKLVEDDLLRRDETLRLAEAAAHLGVWEWDIEAGTLSWTEGMYAIYGLDPATFRPTPEGIGDLIHVDDVHAVDAGVAAILMSPAEQHFETAYRTLWPSGEVRWVVNRGTLLRGPDGTPERMLGVTMDDTERMRSQEERAELETRLLQAQKLEAVGQLAGGVAHDFNNLLVAMRGFGELALGNLGRGEPGAEANIEAVLVAADRAAALTRQLLAFGRRQVLDPQVLDLNDIVRETAGLLERIIGDNVTLVTELSDEPIVVRADRGQLEQVIMNLAVNGRDAMPGGGTLTIEVARGNPERTFALLSVSDEGCGIDATTAAHIFEPFFTTKGEAGTGLGLATVHGIVAQSGGQIMLDSEEGQGSTFMVYLPLCADEVQELAVAPGAPASGCEAILLVEDDPAVRMIVATMLSERGYTIVSAEDGEEALRCFEAATQPFGLVVSDLNLRGLDGQETIYRIRELEPSMKVLYMSGYTDDPIIRGGGLGDRTSFIPKPFSGDALATRVRDVLDGVSVA